MRRRREGPARSEARGEVELAAPGGAMDLEIQPRRAKATAVMVVRRGLDYERLVLFKGEDGFPRAKLPGGREAELAPGDLNQALTELALAESGCRTRGCSTMRPTEQGLCSWCRDALSADLPYVLGDVP